MSNAKLAGSNIVDFIPQSGACPLGCPDCYYNLGVSENAEWIKAANHLSPQDTANKIVRVNSGHDSNLCRDDTLILASPNSAVAFKHAFFNTSLPRFDFPRPVVFTANPGWMKWQFHEPATHWKWDNLMFVRFLVPDLTIETRIRLALAAKPYLARDLFIVLTFMRYTERPKKNYGYTQMNHFTHYWWAATLPSRRCFLNDMLRDEPTFQGRLGVCGGLDGDERCAACGICESTYWAWQAEKGLAKWAKP